MSLASAEEPAVTYLNAERGVRSWLLTHDHKRIALMYAVLILASLLLGGLFAMLLRLKLLVPGPAMVSPLDYNRLFTLHGVVMVWLFMIPAIPSIFGNFLLPLMLGARDVAFPRLNLLSLYLYAIGSGITLWGMLHGGADTGWTFYTPYSTTTSTDVVPILLGVFVIGFSSILTGVNFLVTTHTLRAPGITWFRMPLFVWSIYATSIIQTLATPVLGLVLLLVAIERAFGFGIFDPSAGGDPVLFQHLFWFYSHPAVYIMVLPSFAVMSECVCAMSRKSPFNYKAIAYSSVGIAFVGFFTWGHHMFVSGQSTFGSGVFGVLSMFVGIFTAIKVFNWVGTLYRGSILVNAPLIYVCGLLFFLVFGGMTGIGVATVSLDVHWTDTYFVVAHFHFIMVGVTIMAFLMGLHYWFPKMFGRLYNERWAMVAAFIISFGFIATFLPQFLMGNGGMPRRYYTYPERFQALHVASSAGASLLFIGLLIVAIDLAVALVAGAKSGQNPWGSSGFEWLTPSPPPKHNWEALPSFERGPYGYDSIEEPEHGTAAEGP